MAMVSFFYLTIPTLFLQTPSPTSSCGLDLLRWWLPSPMGVRVIFIQIVGSQKFVAWQAFISLPQAINRMVNKISLCFFHGGLLLFFYKLGVRLHIYYLITKLPKTHYQGLGMAELHFITQIQGTVKKGFDRIFLIQLYRLLHIDTWSNFKSL